MFLVVNPMQEPRREAAHFSNKVGLRRMDFPAADFSPSLARHGMGWFGLVGRNTGTHFAAKASYHLARGKKLGDRAGRGFGIICLYR